MEPTQSPANGQNMVLYLSAEQTAIVKVTIDSSSNGPLVPLWTRTYNIPANSVIASDIIPKAGSYDARLFSLPPSFGGTGGEGTFRKKGIHIESNVPIVAYAHIYGSVSSGATMLLPTETWGYSYTSVNSFQANAAASYSWMYILAKNDNTVVEVTPSVLTRSGKPANVPFTVNLMKGQIYQVVATGDDATGNGEQLTGTKVKSIANASGDCYPIAVFSGSSRTLGEPLCTGGGGRDNDMQQCFPHHAWGKRYLTAPMSRDAAPNNLMGNVYKIAIKDPSTVVKINGVTTSMLPVPLALQNNSYYIFHSNVGSLIEADKPIMVAQFMAGGSNCASGLGDPEMVYVSPVEQAIKSTGFYRNTVEAISVNYLTLIIPNNGMNSLKIDNVAWSTIPAAAKHSYIHPQDPNYTVAIRRWASNQSQCLVSSDSGFNAITYGLGGAESYGYNAGTYLNNLNAVGNINNVLDTTTTSHSFTCTNTPVKLSILLRYKPTKLIWKLSNVGSVLAPNNNVTDNNPICLDSPVVGGIKYYKYSLPLNYTFSVAGTYNIPIEATHPSIENCNNKEDLSFDVVVKVTPLANFSTLHTGCTKDTVAFTGALPTGYNISKWQWTFPDLSTDTTRTPIKLFAPGTQAIKLRVISAEGCVGDTTKNITIYNVPTANFGFTPETACEGTAINFTDSSVYDGSAVAPINSFVWSYGNGRVDTVATNAAQSFTYTTYGNFIIKHVAKVSALCVSDTVSKPIVIKAIPRTPFIFPAGCLPTNGVVQFTSNAFAPDNSPIATHSWNFGDVNATITNPNQSNLPNPTHIYPYGPFTITYTATAQNGCSKDTVVSTTFNIKPALQFTPLNSICESVAGSVSIANGSVTNAVPGTSSYSGPGTSSSGQFTPSLAGAGLHTIWYVYDATSGCKDSVSQTILVFAKPRAKFTYPLGGCLPVTGVAQFTNASTISDGQTMNYTWNFGDANATVTNPNISTQPNPTHIYSNFGNYNIQLSVLSSNGCVGDTTVNATFSVKPAISFTPLANVCENVTTVNVASSTGVTNGVAGISSFSGNGISQTGIFTPAVAGFGTHAIKFLYTSTGGCADSLSQNIFVHAKPLAKFTYPLGGCLPVDGFAQFTNTTTIGDAQTMNYNWNFGDANATVSNPNTSTLTNPSHNFVNFGNYTLVLTATTNNGCIDDTTITTTFSVKPSLAYPALGNVCENIASVNVATGIVTNGAVGTAAYYGTATTTAGIFNPLVSGHGTFPIKYVYTANGGCADSITRNITVYDKPTVGFSYPTGCLPTTGIAQFTNTTTIADGQILSYSWNFGDANATISNPNTSATTSPSHTYTSYNTYTIKLTANTQNGCTADSTVILPLGIKPAITFNNLPPVCENIGTISVALGAVTNNVSGVTTYSGAGTSIDGILNPSIAGSGSHEIKYLFTASGGCADSLTKSILVRAKPIVGFTYPTNCLPTNGLAQFTNISSINDGQTVTYNWNFGDANATVANPNTSTQLSPTHIFKDYGTYAVSLTATTNNGCLEDTVINIPLNVTPALTYGSLTNVCENIPSFSIANASVTNAVTGTGIYSGAGTTTAGLFNPSTATPGQHLITYTYTSNGGCVASATSNITVYLQPIISAGPSFVVPLGSRVYFNPTVNDSLQTIFRWTPAADFSNNTLLRPSIIANKTQMYTLTAVSNVGNCIAVDTMMVNIVRPFKIPNAFSPNGDGINDKWMIENLSDYPNAVVEVFNRQGQIVYKTNGSYKPWDGIYKNNPLPVGTYYYLIDPKNGDPIVSGYVLILK